MTTQPQERDIAHWLQDQFDLLEYAEHMDEGVDKRRLLRFRGRYQQARDEITRLRAQPSPREVALREALRDHVIWTNVSLPLIGKCGECGSRWEDGTESHKPDCLASPAQKGEKGNE